MDELRDEVDGGEVLGAEEVAVLAEVLDFSIDEDFVGHAAGLGAFAAVCGALAEGFAGEALAGVGDAEGSMDEDFDGRCGFGRGGDFGDLLDGELAGEDGALHGEEGLDEFEAIGGGDGHLGRGVEFDVWGDFSGHFGKAEVLDDEGVDSGAGDEPELAFGGFEFAGEDEGVHRDEAFDAVLVEEVHQLGEVVFGEVVGAEAGVESGETEEDGVGTGGDGGAGAVPVSGGAEEFGFDHGGD